ncbi:MAG: DUF2478 domain-containing protein [Hyphomicrobiaceae bacterium]
MTEDRSEHPILALTYTDGPIADAALRRLWTRLSAAGASCAGLLERDEPIAGGGARCDMILDCLSTGQQVRISEDRGPHARGCRLDLDGLAQALESEKRALLTNPDVLIINKFGKTESTGGGLRPLISAAMELEIPILIAVPWRNIENWRLFAGDLSIERAAETLSADDERDALSAIGLQMPDEAPVSRSARPDPRTL